jgi:alpha-glucoside transport system substrate-binding protein
LTGDEGDTLKGTYKNFEDATGIKVKYVTTPDIGSVLRSRTDAGNPPDVAIFQTGVMREYAAEGKLLNLSDSVGDKTLEENFNPSLLNGLRVKGKVYGTTLGFNPFMLWYNPKTYDGPKNSDASWADVMSWASKSASKGKAPFCAAQNGQGSGGSSGAQMIEVLFAKKYGAEKLRQWGEGKLAWTSPEVKDAWKMFGEIATKDSMVNGGVSGILSQQKAEGPGGIVTGGCKADLWASWVPVQVQSQTENMQPKKNLDFERVPASNKSAFNTEIYQTDAIFAFSKTPAVKAFMAWNQSAEEQSLLASYDMWPVANKNVKPSTYKNPLLKKVAEEYLTDPDVELSAGPNTLNNSATTATFWNGVMQYIDHPEKLDSILRKIEATVH